jgi:SAM-dependent methyltransferase
MDGDAGFASVCFAGVYDAIYADPAFLTAQLAFLASAFAGVSDPLLDAGCGTGQHLVPLCKRGYRIVGMDISRTMLGRALTAPRAGTLRRLLIAEQTHRSFGFCPHADQ